MPEEILLSDAKIDPQHPKFYTNLYKMAG
jgi:hypothetical protein